jgi:hypothetical protein
MANSEPAAAVLIAGVMDVRFKLGNWLGVMVILRVRILLSSLASMPVC